MWNAQMSGLLSGTTCCILTATSRQQTIRLDHALAPGAELNVTFFGAGAAFFANCLKAGVDLSALPT